MIPLTAHINELKVEKAVLEEEAKEVMKEQGMQVDYQFGTMIEIPRAALTAGEIARYAQFFSFGTNDLTQTTFGISRDDAETGFLLEYLEKRILPENPFATHRRGGRGQAHGDGRAASAARRARTSRWASAASTAATPRPSPSATASGWTT